MKRLLLPIVVMLFALQGHAQEVKMNLNLGVDDILMQQAWSIDDPESEPAREVIEVLMFELNSFYAALNAAAPESFTYDFTSIDAQLKKAKTLKLNIDAFKPDLDFIDSYR